MDMNIYKRLLAAGVSWALLSLALPIAAQSVGDARILKLNHTDTPSGARHQA